MRTSLIALLFCAGIAASCGGNDDPEPSATATSPAATPGPTNPLSDAELPDRDVVDLARRFGVTTSDIDPIARDQPYGYSVGDSEEFWGIDLNAPEIVTVSATVREISERAYFFVQDGERYSEESLQKIGSDFDSLVYPTVTSSFGKEWTPGVDSDPRLTILHADLSGAGGYFSARDEHPIAIMSRSNEREMLYLTSAALESPGAGYNALVGHELQHLIQWYADGTEDSWVNEGLSEVAAGTVSPGGASGGSTIFLENPDTQLTFWPDVGDSSVNYAASSLFFNYLLDQYGGVERAIDLVQEARDNTAGVDAYLAEFGSSFEDVFADWVVANYVNGGDGVYSHKGTSDRVETLTPLVRSGNETVGQYASDYLDARNVAPGTVVTFDGADAVGIGVPERSGPFWWSNRGDSIDTRLTREFDLSDVDSATLRFSTWYQIENGWDYGYVAASTDGGDTWEALSGRETTYYDPIEAAYGPGYTGESAGWVEEVVDLSAYAGGKVLVRFELITDDATSFTGMAIDDIQVPEIDYADDASSEGDWQDEGWVPVSGPLEQRFIVQKIEGTRDNPKVTRIELDNENRAQISLDESAVIVVSGATGNTAEKAPYSWELQTP
jgi:hypothetical protein